MELKMSIEYVTFDTIIYDEDDNEIKVCVEATIEKGYPASFNPKRECWDAPASDDVEIIEILNYETNLPIDITSIDTKTIEKLEEEALAELY